MSQSVTDLEAREKHLEELQTQLREIDAIITEFRTELAHEFEVRNGGGGRIHRCKSTTFAFMVRCSLSTCRGLSFSCVPRSEGWPAGASR